MLLYSKARGPKITGYNLTIKFQFTLSHKLGHLRDILLPSGGSFKFNYKKRQNAAGWRGEYECVLPTRVTTKQLED